MKILLHACCGPCAIIPAQSLSRAGLTFRLWFYNPNIQPWAEFTRRRDSLAYLALQGGYQADFSPPYQTADYLAAVRDSFEAPERCRRCFRLRLRALAEEARRTGFSHISTTLLYSRRQPHDLIREEAEKAARAQGREFFYQDWRTAWKQGFNLSRELGLYRQNYCGCLYSQL